MNDATWTIEQAIAALDGRVADIERWRDRTARAQ